MQSCATIDRSSASFDAAQRPPLSDRDLRMTWTQHSGFKGRFALTTAILQASKHAKQPEMPLI